MRKVVVGVDQLFDPRIRVQHHFTEPKARLRVARNVEIELPFADLREWLGEVGLELGRAEEDTLAGYSNEPNTTLHDEVSA